MWSMDAAETTATLDQVQSAKAQLGELEARLLNHADRIEIPAESGATSTANWHAHRTRTTRSLAHRTMRLADGLETRDATRTALAQGSVHVEQAEVILNALADLPDDLDPDLADQAEAHLLEQAQHFDAKALKILGRRILEVIDPEAADAHEAALLERRSATPPRRTRLTMYDDGHGKVHGRFTLDTLTGAALSKALHAIAAPKHQASQGPLGERNPHPSGSGRRSPSTSAATRPNASPRPAASTPPSWS